MSPEQRQDALLPVDAALTAWRRLDLSPSGVSAFRQGQAGLDSDVGTARNRAGNRVRIYATLGISGFGADRCHRPLVPLRLIFVGLISNSGES